MPEPLLDAVEINPAAPARAIILWLHGLGADGHDFEPLVPQLGIVEELGVRVILPHAPRRPVTINGGMLMPAWYDIAGTSVAVDAGTGTTWLISSTKPYIAMAGYGNVDVEVSVDRSDPDGALPQRVNM